MKVYLDNGSTTKIAKSALEAMLAVMENGYGNPSSIHSFGQKAKTYLETAREEIANCIGASAREIYFTSGGTEADNQAIYTAAVIGAKQGKKHIISSQIEHHAVSHFLQILEKDGYQVTYVAPNEEGIVTVDSIRSALREDTCLVSIMYVNNEVGTIQPIAEIGKLCREHQVLFHTDGVQAVGHIPVNVMEDLVDFMSFSAHKFHGPKGVGGIYVRKGITLERLLYGGGQERNKRSGTENVAGIVGMSAALKEACEKMQERSIYVKRMREYLYQELLTIEACYLNGSLDNRVVGNLNVSFACVEGESLLLRLDMKGIAASSGSACTAGSLDPSHVLLAMGKSISLAKGALRITISHENTIEEIEYTVDCIKHIVEDLRSYSLDWEKRIF